MNALAVATGAALGALMRWGLGRWLNALHPWLPLGTLTANLLGGLLIGLILSAFDQHPHWSPALKLFLVTGFLGGLTTFSSFSAEVIGLYLQQHYGAALLTAALHLIGSLLLTLLGIWLVRQILV